MSVNSRVSPFEVNSLWKTTRREFKTTTAKSNNSDEVNSPKRPNRLSCQERVQLYLTPKCFCSQSPASCMVEANVLALDPKHILYCFGSKLGSH